MAAAPNAVDYGESAQAGTAEALRREVQGLEQKLASFAGGAGAGGGGGRGAPGAGAGDLNQMQAEQLKAKDTRIKQLQAELAEEREQAESRAGSLRGQLEKLEELHAAKKMELQRERAGADPMESSMLAAEIAGAEKLQKQLQEQLKRLENNAFISKADVRRETHRKVSDLEEVLKKRSLEYDGCVEALTKAEQARLTVLHGRQRLEQRCRDLSSKNERLQQDIDARSNEIQRVDREMRMMRERLPPEQQEALENALQVMATSQAAAFARVERNDPAMVPSIKDLATPDSMARIVERLRSERLELSRQIESLRAEAGRESAASRRLKMLQQQELDGARQKSRSYLQDREKWERIAAAHLQTIEDLQSRISSLGEFRSSLDAPDEEASLAGFSELSDLEGCENALDIFVGRGEVNPAAAATLEASGAAGGQTSEKLRTVVCVELRGFDTGYSAVASGLQPTFDSLVSFGPFEVDDPFLDYLSTGSLSLELRGALPAGEEQQLLGRGSLELATLLKPSPVKRNPAVSISVPIHDVDDPEVSVARVRVKLRLRYEIRELLEDYQHRLAVKKMGKEKLGEDLDPKLAGALHTLAVQVHRASGLPPGPGQLPNQMRPYVHFQVVGHPPNFTKTCSGPHPVFNESFELSVRVDATFAKWTESSGGLHVVAFDDAAGGSREAAVSSQPDAARALGFLSEAKVSLQPLLHNALAVVEGPFTLRADLADPASPAAGMLDVSIYWKDFTTSVAPPPPPAPVPAAPAAQAAALPRGPPGPPAAAAPAPAAPRPGTAVEQPAIGGRPAAPAQRAARGAGAATMSDEHFGIVAARLLEHLRAAGVQSIEMAIRLFDQDGDGRLSCNELEQALAERAPNLSQEERALFVDRADMDRDGSIGVDELSAALGAAGDAHAQAKQRAEGIFARIRTAIARSQHPPSQVFASLCKTQQGLMRGAEFLQLVRGFAEDLDMASVQLMWQLVDKNNDGSLAYEEFARFFAEPPPSVHQPVQQPSGRGPASAPAQAPAHAHAQVSHAHGCGDPYSQAPAAPSFAPQGPAHGFGQARAQAVAAQRPPHAVSQQQAPSHAAQHHHGGSPMTEEYFGICAGRLLRRLHAANVQSVEMAIRRFDRDGDGRLSRQELEHALATEAPNLSRRERADFAARMDADNDGVITVPELEAAFHRGHAELAQAEQKAGELFERIRSAIVRSGHPPQAIFASMCQAQGVMQRPDFERLLQGFAPDAGPEGVTLMWQLVDKNNDGGLVYEEFARFFAEPSSVHQPAQQPSGRGPAHAPAQAPAQAQGGMATGAARQASRAQDLVDQIRQVIQSMGATPDAFFRSLDRNKDGTLSAEEFAAGLAQFGIGEDRLELRKLFLQIEGATLGRLPIAKVVELVLSGYHAGSAPAQGAGAAQGGAAAGVPRKASPPVHAGQAMPVAAHDPAAARMAAAEAAARRAQASAPVHAGQVMPAVAQDPAAARTAAAEAAARRAQAEEVSERVRGAIARSSSSSAVPVCSLYTKCLSSRPLLTRADFDKLMQMFVPALQQEVLNILWVSVAGDAAAQALTLTKFCDYFCTAAAEAAAPSLASGKHVLAYLHRLDRILRMRGGTTQSVFAPFDSSGSGALGLEEFLMACRRSGISLSQFEAENLFFQLLRRGDAQQRLYLADLEAAMQSSAYMPEAQWVQGTVADIRGRAYQAGSLLEDAFARTEGERVDAELVREEFGKYLTLDKEQWATIMAFLEKSWEGYALWREFLGWACQAG